MVGSRGPRRVPSPRQVEKRGIFLPRFSPEFRADLDIDSTYFFPEERDLLLSLLFRESEWPVEDRNLYEKAVSSGFHDEGRPHCHAKFGDGGYDS